MPQGDAPINAVEGFIRQIIGWREYVRGIYFLEGPDYTSRNVLGHGPRPAVVLLGWRNTDELVWPRRLGQTQTQAYAHHIQRLMVDRQLCPAGGD